MTMKEITVLLVDGSTHEVKVDTLPKADHLFEEDLPDIDEWTDTVLIPAVEAAGLDPDDIDDWWH